MKYGEKEHFNILFLHSILLKMNNLSHFWFYPFYQKTSSEES